MQIFLSYRRGDVGGYAGRLADALVQRLGPNSVFQDVVAIAPGEDFTAAIDRALEDCDAVLAVIGPGWLTAATPQGARRLLEADDYVRLELARALNRDVRVVPVLVGGATLPAASDLPDELKGLVRRQAVVLHDETWHQDVDGLVESLRGKPAVPATRSRRLLATGAVAVALVVLGAAAWLWGPGTGSGSGSGGQRPPSTSGGAPAGAGTGMAVCAPAEGEGWNEIELNDNPTAEGRDPAGPLRFTVNYARWRANGGTWQLVLATSMKNATSVTVRHADYTYSALVVGGRPFDKTCFSTPTEVVGAGQTSDALIGFGLPCEPGGYMELGVPGGTVRVTKDLQPRTC
jgi:hypothetical protein